MIRILASLAVVILAICACGAQAPIPVARQAGVEAAGGMAKRLFVSDAGTGEIYVYDVPSLKLLTLLQGFARPGGECADDKGHIWVTDSSAQEIYELSYSGRIEHKLSETTGYPEGCAWDPKTGNLAVTNYLGTKSNSGNVLIYHHASGYPNTYVNPKQYYYDFGGYDGSGNLFFDGSNAQGQFMLSELPAKADQAQTISVGGGKIYSPGMVQWDNASGHLDVGDQLCGNAATSCLYQTTISGKKATIENEIGLETYTGSEVCDVVQGVLDAGELFASDDDYCGYAPSATYGWGYPAGGSPKSYQKKNDSMPIGAAIAVNGAPQVKHHGNAAPWMDLRAKKLDLLYIADGNGEVTVYTYWQKTLVGELTDFSEPEGECVDKNNDVYITDAGEDAVVEYAHAGKKPLRTIDESPFVPYACAVDFTTGDLAIANKSGGSNGEGNIAIYSNASGTPTLYTDATLGAFTACAYDNRGNLLVTNSDAYYGVADFAWLPKGGEQLVNISIPGPNKNFSWEDVGGLQWDGRYFVIDSYDAAYRVSIQSGEAYYVGATYLGEEVWGPYWIYNSNPKKQGTQLVSPYREENYSAVEYFNYPAGGDSFAYLSNGITDPNGVTVSLGKIHE